MGISRIKEAYNGQVSKLNKMTLEQWNVLIENDERKLKRKLNCYAQVHKVDNETVARNIIPNLNRLIANVTKGREERTEINYGQAEQREERRKEVARLEKSISRTRRWISNLHREKSGAPPRNVSRQTKRKWKAMREIQKRELGELAKNLQGEPCERKRMLRVCWLATKHHRADMKHVLL